MISWRQTGITSLERYHNLRSWPLRAEAGPGVVPKNFWMTLVVRHFRKRFYFSAQILEWPFFSRSHKIFLKYLLLYVSLPAWAPSAKQFSFLSTEILHFAFLYTFTSNCLKKILPCQDPSHTFGSQVKIPTWHPLSLAMLKWKKCQRNVKRHSIDSWSTIEKID